jgi:iron-sulfur cluster repair protein YtfE (RIC family)
MKISEYFEKDHDRLDELFASFQKWKRADFKKAKDYFVGFKFGLQRHIIWEEDILFPLFERKTGITQGPTHVMRLEHRMIGDRLEAIHAKVKSGSPESDQEEKALLEVLSVHNMKEEHVLYPAIDFHSDERDTQEVFRQMEAMPAERYEHCCGHTVTDAS